jgi:hypothetical protein
LFDLRLQRRWWDTAISCEREKQLNEIAVSDRAALAGLTQFPATPATLRRKPLNGKVIEEKLRKRRRVR